VVEEGERRRMMSGVLGEGWHVALVFGAGFGVSGVVVCSWSNVGLSIAWKLSSGLAGFHRYHEMAQAPESSM